MVDQLRLSADLGAILRFALASAHGNEPSQRTTEVDVLDMLIDRFVPEAIELVRVLGLEEKISVAGVLCHQRPYVRWPPPPAAREGGCELGDLLIVAYHRPTGALQGLLLQAKVDGRADVGGDQERLYTVWPRFAYRHGDRDERELESAPHEGARYGYAGLCDPCADGCWRPPGWWLHPLWVGDGRVHREEWFGVVEVGGGSAVRLEAVLASMMLGSPVAAAVSYEPDVVARSEGWDRVVWDLLERNARKTYMHRRRRRGDRVRVVEGSIFDVGERVGRYVAGPGLRLDWCARDIADGFAAFRTAPEERPLVEDPREVLADRARRDDDRPPLPPDHDDDQRFPDGGIPMILIESGVVQEG